MRVSLWLIGLGYVLLYAHYGAAQRARSTTTVRNPYRELGVPRSASLSEIKRMYRKLSKQYHPDKNPNNERAAQKFLRIQEAYDQLVGAKDSSSYSSSANRRDPLHSSPSILLTESNFDLLIEDGAQRWRHSWLLFIYTRNCPLCEEIAHEWDQLVQDSDYQTNLIQFARVNYRESHDLIQSRLRIRRIPSLVIVRPRSLTNPALDYVSYGDIFRAKQVTQHRLHDFIQKSITKTFVKVPQLTMADRWTSSSDAGGPARLLFITTETTPFRRLQARYIATQFQLHLNEYYTDPQDDQAATPSPSVSFGLMHWDSSVSSLECYPQLAMDTNAHLKSESLTTPTNLILIQREFGANQIVYQGAWWSQETKVLKALLDRKNGGTAHTSYVPRVNAHTYYDLCMKPIRRLCLLVLTRGPLGRDRFLTKIGTVLYSKSMPHLQLGGDQIKDARYHGSDILLRTVWLDTSHETEFAEFFSTRKLGRGQYKLVVTRPFALEYLEYKGAIDSSKQIKEWLDLVLSRQLAMKHGRRNTGLPFPGTRQSWSSVLDPIRFKERLTKSLGGSSLLSSTVMYMMTGTLAAGVLALLPLRLV